MSETKGSWKMDQRVGCIAVYEQSKDFNCLDIDKSNFVAYWSGHCGNKGWELAEKDKANAQLISAAPDMYEALKKVIHWIPTPDQCCDIDRDEVADMRADIFAAIQKAEGRNA